MAKQKRDQFVKPYTGPDDPERPRGEPYQPPLKGESRQDYEERTARDDDE